MKKQESKKFNKTLVFTIVIMALFISIISIEIITITLSNKNTEGLLDNYIPNKKAYQYYSIDDDKFNGVQVDDETSIGTMCTAGCYLKVNDLGVNYYYMITHNSEGYKLNIIKNNRVILSGKSLGNYIENAYFKKYMDYIVLYNTIDDGTYEYDYALILDENANIDEFTSLNSNEIEFTSDGIIYYYDVCADESLGESQKIKAIRKPFNISPKALEKEYKEYTWC